MKKRVLIAEKTHPVLEEKLTHAGFFCEHFSGNTLNELNAIIGEYVGIIVRSRTKLTAEILSAAVQLKFIGRLGSGMENIDTEYADFRGIVCFNSPEGNCDAVGEHAVGMLLALVNHIHTADREVRNKVWKRETNKGMELGGKTIGIIGYGHTGPAFAKRLCGWGVNLLVYDKYKSGFGNDNVIECQMDRIYNEADILSFHIPLTSETRYLFNDDYLGRFQKNIIVINTSRGEIVDTATLVWGLKSGKVSGAALDVIDYEDLLTESLDCSKIDDDFRFICGQPNVVLTPHIAGVTAESRYKLSAVLADKIVKFYTK